MRGIVILFLFKKGFALLFGLLFAVFLQSVTVACGVLYP